MSNFTTKLIKNLSNNVSVEEIFRAELEKAFNQLLETELACFLGYEKYSKDGYNTGDFRTSNPATLNSARAGITSPSQKYRHPAACSK